MTEAPSPVFFGIDPGASGGIALLWDTGHLLRVVKMPRTETDILLSFGSYWRPSRLALTNAHACIEKVHSFPGQGVASTFKFGRSYGFLRGCLIASKIPFEAITPRVWQKAMGIEPRKKTKVKIRNFVGTVRQLKDTWDFTESKVQFKNRIKGVAQRLFPEEKITLATCDALLLAEFCRRKYFERLGKHHNHNTKETSHA